MNKRKKCTVRRCGGVLLARGLCRKHYERLPERVAYKKTAERRAKNAAYNQQPVVRARKKIFRSSEEQREKAAAYYRIPEVNARYKKYHDSPEQRAFRKAYTRTLKGLYTHATAAAKRRSLQWDLSFEQFSLLRGENCIYCQFQLPEVGCGLDRKDNTQGYVISNVVPCCAICNFARNHHFTHEEMLNEIGPVLRKVKLARVAPPVLPTYAPLEVST